jgi:glycosyltransferase involved in cell wall biosynthesis
MQNIIANPALGSTHRSQIQAGDAASGACPGRPPIPPKNSQALFEAMLRLSNDFELRNKMSVNSRSFIVKRYSRIDIWNSIEEEYNDLLFKAIQ